MLSPDNNPVPTLTDIVDEAITSRRSVRAFLPTPVDEATIRDILTVASRAPSGTNMQPWRTYVATGETLKKIADAVLNSGIRAEKAKWDEYKYYPDQFFEPYLSRRRKVGFDLYGCLGIGKRDTEQMRAQHDRNFVFFDAPVGMIFTIDRRLNQGSWIDYGMFLENIMIAARAQGAAHLPAGGFRALSQPASPGARPRAGRSRRLRHGARLRGRLQARKRPAHRPRPARRVGDVQGVGGRQSRCQICQTINDLNSCRMLQSPTPMRCSTGRCSPWMRIATQLI